MIKADLSKYNNVWYKPGSKLKIFIWMLTCSILFSHSLPTPNKIKVLVLKLFGASIGKYVVIKPRVTIKYPWFLSIGDYSWIGEGVWIDNIAKVSIGSHCCVSQGAYLLTGNHDYTKCSFDLIIGKIILKDGSWVGAKATVCPGVTLGVGAILSVGSVATKSCDDFGVYQGNPATFKKSRVINEN